MKNYLNVLIVILTITDNIECGFVKNVYDNVKIKAQAYSDGISHWITSSFDKLLDDTKEYKMEEVGENPQSRSVQNEDVAIGREIVKNAYNGLRTSISLVGEQVLGDDNTKPNGEKKGLVTNIFDKVENLTILAKDTIVEEAKILKEKTKGIGVGLTSIIFPDRNKYSNKNKTAVNASSEMLNQTKSETSFLKSNSEKSHISGPETSLQPNPGESSKPRLIFQPDPELPQWAKLSLHSAFPQMSHQIVTETPIQFDPVNPYLTNPYLSAQSNPQIPGSQHNLDLQQWSQSDILLAPYPVIEEPARPKIPIQLGAELQQVNPEMLFQSDVYHVPDTPIISDTSGTNMLRYPAMPSDIMGNSYQLFNPKMLLRKNSQTFNETTELEVSNQTAIPKKSVSSPTTTVISKESYVSSTTISVTSKASSVSSTTISVPYETSSVSTATSSVPPEIASMSRKTSFVASTTAFPYKFTTRTTITATS